jgi:hypothetical protein
MDPIQVIAASLGFSTVFLILLIIGINELGKQSNPTFTFIDLIRESDDWPSLVRFQLLVWTLIVVFCFLTVALARILSNLPAVSPDIPENLLILIGISVSVTPVSIYVSKKKYEEQTPESKIADKQLKASEKNGTPIIKDENEKTPVKEATEKEITQNEIDERRRARGYGSMLLEDERPSITRFQMFSWTIIGVLIYAGIFIKQLYSFTIATPGNFSDVLILPDIDFALVALMGLSQAAYVGGKYVSPTKPKIFSSISPNPVMEEQETTIIGINFGKEKGAIRIGGKTILPSDIAWSESKITFKVPKLDPPVETKFNVTVLIGADTFIAPELLTVTPIPRPKIDDVKLTPDKQGIIITGINFGSEAGKVLLDDVSITGPPLWTNTGVTVTPLELEANKEYAIKLLIGKLEVKFPKIIKTTKIDKLDSTDFHAGDSVTIKGDNLGAKEDGKIIVDNKEITDLEEWTDTSITFKLPEKLAEKDYEIKLQIKGKLFPVPNKITIKKIT